MDTLEPQRMLNDIQYSVIAKILADGCCVAFNLIYLTTNRQAQTVACFFFWLLWLVLSRELTVAVWGPFWVYSEYFTMQRIHDMNHSLVINSAMANVMVRISEYVIWDYMGSLPFIRSELDKVGLNFKGGSCCHISGWHPASWKSLHNPQTVFLFV